MRIGIQGKLFDPVPKAAQSFPVLVNALLPYNEEQFGEFSLIGVFHGSVWDAPASYRCIKSLKEFFGDSLTLEHESIFCETGRDESAKGEKGDQGSEYVDLHRKRAGKTLRGLFCFIVTGVGHEDVG